MKVLTVQTLLSCGAFSQSKEWADARKLVHDTIAAVDNPAGSGKFTINPARKKNGVVSIKTQFQRRLLQTGWQKEKPIQLTSELQPGNLDFMLSTTYGAPIAIEWETGNISSSHRSMNKLAVGLVQGVIRAAVMIVPDRSLAKYLTDRVGNFQELAPYFPFWSAIACPHGVFEIVSFTHDLEDSNIKLLAKGNDGNARRAKEKLKKEVAAAVGP
jgi:hypothetical protein